MLPIPWPWQWAQEGSDGLIHGGRGLLSREPLCLSGCAGQVWRGLWPRTSREEWEVPRGRVGLAEGELGGQGQGQHRGRRKGLDAFGRFLALSVANGSGREGGRQEGKPLLLRFSVGGAEPEWPHCRGHRGLSGEGSSGVAQEGLWSVGPQGGLGSCLPLPGVHTARSDDLRPIWPSPCIYYFS